MGAQLIEEAECIELADRMGEQVDADAEGAQLAGRIEHVRPRTDLVQAEGRRQASDAGADDDGTQAGPGPVHRTSCMWMRTVLRSRSPVETAMRSFSQLRRGAAVASRTSVRK